ncbi:hypothetical protein GCM10027299_34660 [Larkinella ripae]
MNTKQLCLLALMGAPFLAIGVYVEAYYAPLGNSWWTGVWGLLYITGWMGAVEAMRRLRLTGTDWLGRRITPLVLGTLLIANLSNLWQLVAPTYKPLPFMVLDLAWPLSNLLMLVVGVATLRARQLRGVGRWIPLAVGLWFPLTMAVSRTSIVLHFSNLYSALLWSLMALVVWRAANHQKSDGALRDPSSPESNRVESNPIIPTASSF